MNQNNKNVHVKSQDIVPHVKEGKTLQAIQTPYATAISVQIPRDLAEIERKCLIEASLAGSSCYYGWTAKGTKIEGPSIECAMIAMRNWGNAALEMSSVQETDEAYIITAYFIDLESGTTIGRQFRMSKTYTVYGDMDEVRKDDIRFQVGQSKAQRNVILRSLPNWLFVKMMDKAKAGVKDIITKKVGKDGIEKVKNAVVKALVSEVVKLDRVERKLGKKKKAWDVDTLVILEGDLRALIEETDSAENIFPPIEEDKPATGAPKLASEEVLEKEKVKVSDKKVETTPDEQLDPDAKAIREFEEAEKAKVADENVSREDLVSYLMENIGYLPPNFSIEDWNLRLKKYTQVAMNNASKMFKEQIEAKKTADTDGESGSSQTKLI